MEELVLKKATEFKLDVNLVRAIISTESSWNPFAIRYEPQWRYFYETRSLASLLGITHPTMELFQATSYGLMQIMGSVAYELGFRQSPVLLCDPEINLHYGCKKLKKLFEKYGHEDDVISSYNQGNPRKNNGGMYLNQRYCDKVHSFLIEYRKLKE